MKRTPWRFATGLTIGWLLVAWPAIAAAPLRAEQFAAAIPLTPQAGYPLQQLALPDAVYQRVVSPALNDVAVFDADGVVVPHVFCSAPAQQTVTEAQRPLTVFPVQLARSISGGARAELHTDAGNTIAITVPGGESSGAVAVTAYDLDLGAVSVPATALLVQWHSPSGLSEVHLKVEQADAGAAWQPLVGDAVLKRVTADGQTLEQADIALPTSIYKALRLTPRDAEGTVIDAVSVRTRSIQALPTDWRWFTATPDRAEAAAPTDETAVTPQYDAARRAPVTRARVRLDRPNTRAALRLMSRANAQMPWRTVWAGEAFYLVTRAGERRNDEISLPANQDRYWQLAADPGAAALAATLELAYSPQNLRFIAQGVGPYRLAYGNAAAIANGPTESCEGLLKTLFDTVTTPVLPGTPAATPAVQNLIGIAKAGAPQPLAGDSALQPLVPAATPPWRRWLLWGVLALAVVLLLGMARKLMADLKQSNHRDP